LDGTGSHSIGCDGKPQREADPGSLAPGKKADLVIFDMRRAHLTPHFNPVGTLVHQAHGRDVRTVVVDGRIVVEDGRATQVDARSGTTAPRQHVDFGIG
jgi:cytosine/adenosine deaminase-related metal-dependent hydrolase